MTFFIQNKEQRARNKDR